MLKNLIDKYSEELNTETALNDVEVDMDPTMGVIDVITNENEEVQITKQIEAALSDVEDIVKTNEDVEELEKSIDDAEESTKENGEKADGEEEKKEEGEEEGEEKKDKSEVSTESALKVISSIDKFLDKHNMNSPEQREALGLSNEVTVESATNFPVATFEAAVKDGKTLVEKVKTVLRSIVDKVIKAYLAIKGKILAMLGNNEAVAKKLLGALNGLEDKVIEGKELDEISIFAKFPILDDKVNTKTSLQKVLSQANSGSTLEKVVMSFSSGVAQKNLKSFLELTPAASDNSLEVLFNADKVVPLKVYGTSVSALVSKKDGDVTKVSVENATLKVVTGSGSKLSVLSNADIKSIISDCLKYSTAQKSVLEKLDKTFEPLKNLKIEDQEFAKSAKLESNLAALTKAKLVYADSVGGTIKSVLQIAALNMSVKAKKEAK